MRSGVKGNAKVMRPPEVGTVGVRRVPSAGDQTGGRGTSGGDVLCPHRRRLPAADFIGLSCVGSQSRNHVVTFE